MPRLIPSVGEPPESFARVEEPTRPPFRVAAVQERWHPDPEGHQEALAAGIRMAAAEGAQLICLRELTLSPSFAVVEDAPKDAMEDVPGGATYAFAERMAGETGVPIHASLYAR